MHKAFLFEDVSHVLAAIDSLFFFGGGFTEAKQQLLNVPTVMFDSGKQCYRVVVQFHETIRNDHGE